MVNALFGLLSALVISAAQKIVLDRAGWSHFGPAERREPTRGFPLEPPCGFGVGHSSTVRLGESRRDDLEDVAEIKLRLGGRRRRAFKVFVHIVNGPQCPSGSRAVLTALLLGTFTVRVDFACSNLERRHPMATNPGPRAPYRDEPRNVYREPRSSFSDNASVSG